MNRHEEFHDEALQLALDGMKQIKAFFAYQGSDQRYFQKARIGAMVCSSYTRFRATLANEEALRLAAKRIPLAGQPPALLEGPNAVPGPRES